MTSSLNDLWPRPRPSPSQNALKPFFIGDELPTHDDEHWTEDDLSQFDGGNRSLQCGEPESAVSMRTGYNFYIGEPCAEMHRSTDMPNGIPAMPVYIPTPEIVARSAAVRSNQVYVEYNGQATVPNFCKQLLAADVRDAVVITHAQSPYDDIPILHDTHIDDFYTGDLTFKGGL